MKKYIRQKFAALLLVVKSEIARAVQKVGLTTNSPVIIAIAWRLSLTSYSGLYVSQNKTLPRFRYIILGKVDGIADLDEIDCWGESVSVSLFRRDLLRGVARFIIGQDLDSLNYCLDPNREVAIAKYREFLGKVLRAYKIMFGGVGFIQFNVIYWAEVELRTACIIQSIPFVILHKECLRTEFGWSSMESMLGQCHPKGLGARIAVYNESARRMFTRAGFAHRYDIHTTGCARLDRSHRARISCKPLGNHIVYFMIDRLACAPYIRCSSGWRREFPRRDESVDQSFFHLSQLVIEAVIDSARANPSTPYIIKAKQGLAIAQVEQISASLPPNVRVIVSGYGFEMLDCARAVIGFNTTAVFEAMAAGIPVIWPFFIDYVPPDLIKFELEIGNSCERVTSREAFTQAIEQRIRSSERFTILTKGQQQVLELYFGNADGRAGERLQEFLLSASG